MEFEQKAEEKKMSMSKNIARLAVTAGLTAALSFGGVMAPVSMAFAADAATTADSIKINPSKGNESNRYKAYQIFTADVIDGDNGKVVSNVAWASSEAKQAVLGYLKTVDGSRITDNSTEQEVINYLNGNSSGTGSTTAIKNDNLFNELAKKIEASVTQAGSFGAFDTFKPTDNEGNALQGYYLIVTDMDSIHKSDDKDTSTATSPIFAIVGARGVTVDEKTSIPTVSKAVMDDKDRSWETGAKGDPNKAADSAMDDWVDYKLVGTVASNIDTYSDYNYAFTDKLPDSMTPKFVDGSENNVPDVTVTIDNQTVKNDAEHGYTKEFSNANELIVKFKNLKDCVDLNDAPITVNADSKVTVEYKAKLDSTKIFDNDGKIKEIFSGLVGQAQTNTVKLTYSNNPHAAGFGTTVTNPAYDYTYGIDVTKVGSDKDGNGKYPALKNVEFTLQEVVNDSAQEQYIDAKGVKHSKAENATLKTNRDGKINVVGLDEGTYILKEVKPAPGYNNSAKEGVTFTIRRNLNQAGQDVTPTGSTIDKGNDAVLDNTATASTGKLSFTIVDQKGTGLPLTGLNGVTFTWIAGGAVLCIGVAHLIRSRKQAEESEQE